MRSSKLTLKHAMSIHVVENIKLLPLTVAPYAIEPLEIGCSFDVVAVVSSSA